MASPPPPRVTSLTVVTIGPPRGQPDRLDDLLVPGAAAQVARQRLLDLAVGGIRHPAQQVVAGHHKARRAEAALHGARIDERLLHPVQLARAGQALYGAHLAPLGLA